MTYWYPASRMPLAAIASAISRMSFALTSQPKWFQLFHPIGGVRARPLSWRAAVRVAATESAETAARDAIDTARRTSVGTIAPGGGMIER